jgi:hypothetical protein
MSFLNRILFIFITTISLVYTSEIPCYLYANLNSGFFGMFSVFSYIAGILYDYDNNEYAGLEVNFETQGLYYDPILGPNWWEYYCEPIQLGDKKNSVIKRISDREYMDYAYYPLKYLSKEQVHSIIKKHIKIRDHIKHKADQFSTKNFEKSHIIGIHYRGTDKVLLEAPRIPYSEILNQINLHLNNLKYPDYKVFVATDEEQFIDFMKEMLPGKILTYSTLYSNDSTPLHSKFSNTYLSGEEALIDCLLLSKVNFLIRTTSNLSLWSTYFNPSVPVLELSKRYDEIHN